MTVIRSLSHPHPTLRRTDHLSPVRSFEPGGTIFREADPAHYLFEVVTGTLRLTRLLETGRRQVVAFAHAGDVIGFPAAGRHHSDCEALTEVTLLTHRGAVLADPAANPDLHHRLQSAALAEIASLQDHLLLMARKGACGKLASFLLVLADRHGCRSGDRFILDLAMRRGDIADYLCMTVETVSRSLTRMRLDGLIRLQTAQKIVVLDRDGLKAMAGAE